MITKIHSAIPYGFGGRIVEIEGDANRGLPAFNIVGMASKTINEARERVRSALVNSGFFFPRKKVTISLAPADLKKDGAYLDLPIALAVLELSGQLIAEDTRGKLFVGELALDGKVRPVRGIINIVEKAKDSGVREIFVPAKNLPQATLVSGIIVYGVETLESLYLGLKNQKPLSASKLGPDALKTAKFKANGPFIDHVIGQDLAKRAIEIAVAGHHNLLLTGPPGAGKTMLAQVAANLMPAPTPDEIVALTKIYSLAGLTIDKAISERPFRSPHHTASATSIIGGGVGALPGEISLAHKGILFLDELPEFNRIVLESLRQPLEDKVISVSRTGMKTTYPADFMLIATMNPCPCGYLGDPTHTCSCTMQQIQNYQKKLSGPLMDRIDMFVCCKKVKNRLLANVPSLLMKPAKHSVVKNNITEAAGRQRARFGRDGVFNGSLSSFEVTQRLRLEHNAEQLLKEASERLNLSARSYFKTIKVAQTIADLDRADVIRKGHIAEALTFRRSNP